MTNKRLKYLQFLFTITIILLFILLGYKSNTEINQKYDNNVQYSNVKIPENYSQGKITLTGSYKYIPDKIVSPYDISQYIDKIEMLNVYSIGNLMGGHKATILLTVENNSDKDLSLQFNNIVNNYNLYVNGILTNYVVIQGNTEKNHSPIIDIDSNSKTQIVLQMDRAGFFLFGFVSPPIIDSRENIITNANYSQFKNIVFCVLMITLSIFVIVLSMLRSGKLQDNLYILCFIAIGVVSTTRISMVILNHFNIIPISYPTLIMAKITSLLLISYLLVLFSYYCAPNREENKTMVNICHYSVVIYLVFLVIMPISFYEIAYKTASLFILFFQFCAFLLCYTNIIKYHSNSIYALIILAINYILVYSSPIYYIHTETYNIVITSILSTLILFFKIIYENYTHNTNLKYQLAHKNINLEISDGNIEHLNRRIYNENRTKNHAIRISEENKIRDASTGLFNRLYTSVQIEDSIAKLNDDEFTSLVLIDIDNLKYINSVYGREVTDILILKIANLLQEINLKNDLIARWDGGTFMLMLNKTDIDTAKYIAENIRVKVSELDYLENDTATISTGIVTVGNKSSLELAERSLSTLIASAKKSGRNCIVADNTVVQSRKSLFESYESNHTKSIKH